MDLESKMLVIKKALADICKEHFKNNNIPTKLAYFVMRDICGEFQGMVLDEIMQTTIAENAMMAAQKTTKASEEDAATEESVD